MFPYYGVPVRISRNQVRKDNNQHNAPGDGGEWEAMITTGWMRQQAQEIAEKEKEQGIMKHEGWCGSGICWGGGD